MEILEVSFGEYKEIISDPFNVFLSASFNNLNKEKCDSIHYLLFKEGKFRLGIVGGIRNNTFYSPFSAPFGGFAFINKDIRIQYIDEAITLLIDWAKQNCLLQINITLPPAIYHESFIAKQFNALTRKDFNIECNDLNYSFPLIDFNSDYISCIWHNARKNLKIGFNSNLKFEQCIETSEKELAYSIIQENREKRGFPLRMTWSQINQTIQLVKSDFFLVFNEEIPIAAAIVFYVSEKIVQVIYWGDLPEFAKYKTMNYLSYKVFEHYKNIGLQYVDIGPSTENSIPNYGLCEFKESIGCEIQSKISFKLII